jgi:AraC-like DNA-binding protein
MQSALVLKVRATQTSGLTPRGRWMGWNCSALVCVAARSAATGTMSTRSASTRWGSRRSTTEGTVERSLPGQVFVLHPDELHDGRAEGPGLFGYRQIYLNSDRIASALPALTGRPVPLPFAPPVTDDPVLARVVRMAFARPPEPLALDALVLQLAGGLLRFSPAGLTGTLRCRVDLPAVERGRDFLRSRLTIVQSSEVEAVTGLDRYQFARQFHAVYGTSPYRYSVMRRLDVARGWLRDARPLAETALEAGFADQAHFTRTFKAAFGMTPGRYVKLCAARAGDGAARPAALAMPQK